ncbi:hypothetical protein Ahy_B04g071136 [Arachis hypogaea]|uniref:Uncharacterized protein n=1 Tax=Arachis hypogaea TaxID=3818 RepID=A0A444ZK41_ARAHY|nr:hypothetical protein Ahy_B04g071136 [Arachis hypogaea]
MQLPPSCRRFIRVTIPEETWQIVLWWWRNYGGRHWILLLLKGVQFHSLMWRNKNLLCQGGQGQEQEQLRYVFFQFIMIKFQIKIRLQLTQPTTLTSSSSLLNLN